MDIRWITAFIDRPVEELDVAVGFRCEVTGSSLSPWRGHVGEFATLLPSDGADAHLRVQRTRSNSPGSHIDLHVADVRTGAHECIRFGASLITDHDGYVVLSTPGRMPFCVVAHHGERRRQVPVALRDGDAATLVDQVCIDVDDDVFDEECGSGRRSRTGSRSVRALPSSSHSLVLRPCRCG